MTGKERETQDQLFDFVKEWREDDRLWKTDVDKRLRSVETYITADEAHNRATDRQNVERRKHAFDQRAQITLVVSSLAALGGLVLGAINLLHPHG